MNRILTSRQTKFVNATNPDCDLCDEENVVELQRTKPDAFVEYGLSAPAMATVFDINTYNSM